MRERTCPVTEGSLDVQFSGDDLANINRHVWISHSNLNDDIKKYGTDSISVLT